jgi:PAS domain S-box-containing protein
LSILGTLEALSKRSTEQESANHRKAQQALTRENRREASCSYAGSQASTMFVRNPCPNWGSTWRGREGRKRMNTIPTTRLLREALYLLLGLVALALLTWLCSWLGFRLVSTAFTYLILIVLLSLAGSFVTPAVVSLIALGCLAYFFAPSIYAFRIDYEEDAVTAVAFLTTAWIVAGLVQRIRARQDELANLFDSIRALVWNASPDGAVDFSNQRFREYTGFSTEQLRGWGWMDALHPEDRRPDEWRAALAAGEAFEKEARLRSASGEYRWFVLRLMPIRNERGTVSKWYGIASDIENRRRTLEALRVSEERWRAVFEHNPTMYFIVDAGGTVLSVNPFGAEQLGYSVDELVGRSVLDVFHPADRSIIELNAAKCLEAPGQATNWEARKLRKDRTMLWVRETARAMLMKGRPVLLIVCEDISDRKRTENLNRRIFECLPDLVSVIDRDYRYCQVNPTYEQVWGVPADKIIGTHARDLVGQDTFDRRSKPNLDRCFCGEAASFAEWIDSPAGRKYWVVTYSPLQVESERVEAALMVARDLTELMRASDKIRDAENQLAHANRVATMGQLTASIAHEVNQPITGVVTNAHAALRFLDAEPVDVNELRQILDDIVRGGNRASEIVARIGRFVKKRPPRLDRFDMNEAILEVVSLTRSQMADKGVSLHTDLARSLPPVHADRIQLQQVLLNLIVNAIEAMTSEANGSRNLLISADADEANGVRVAVADSGPGVRPDGLERLFDAFYTTKYSGMGMGLAISRSIVEAHGGRLWVAPNSPRGAVFQFNVPARAPES